MTSPPTSVELFILGAGWTSSFLIPLCTAEGVSWAATARSPGKSPHATIPFEFDPFSDDPAPFRALPDAQTVLITFPIRIEGASARLVRLYKDSRHGAPAGQTTTGFIQLGSTGIWDGGPTLGDGAGQTPIWTDRHSPFDTTNARGRAENELLALAPSTPTTVLNLCGLWGGSRDPKRFLPRAAVSKEYLRTKSSIHMIHGADVARAVLAVHRAFGAAAGERWLLTDQRVYDWWDVVSAWSAGGEQARWVRELVRETDVRALPRSAERLGRALDSREFWETFGLDPVQGRM